MNYIYVAIILILLFLLGFILYKKTRIDLKYYCENGQFHIKGRKNNFKIHKNDRFVFHVVNGQVVSFIDKSITENPITYGGDMNGNS